MAQNEIADEAWANYRKRNDSVIVDNLHGQLRGTLVCPQCGKVSVKFDPFCFLSVPVPTREEKNDIFTLSECIELFIKEERLSEQDSWYCPQCKDHVRATKKLDIWRLPPVLVVHLKRFQYSRWSGEKVETAVDVPGRCFNLGDLLPFSDSGAVYDLISVCLHEGGLSDGHYNTSALNGDQWYYFNDARVSKTSPPYSSPSSSPYML
ncbi:hypothetical protein PENTCL1PPCAC_4626, partial [Pristionchus entomophagus]